MKNWLCIVLLVLMGCAGMEKPPVQTVNQQITNPSLSRALQEVDISTARRITDEEAKEIKGEPMRTDNPALEFLSHRAKTAWTARPR